VDARLLGELGPGKFVVGVFLRFPGVRYLDALTNRQVEPGDGPLDSYCRRFCLRSSSCSSCLLGFVFAPDWTPARCAASATWLWPRGVSPPSSARRGIGAVLILRGVLNADVAQAAG